MSSPTQTKGTALVTGAAQGVYHCLHDPVIDSDLFLVGIGRAIALRLAADGFDVAINDIASKAAQLDGVKDEIIAAGRRSAVFGGDVSVDADVKAMVAGVVEALGGLDVVSATPLSYFDC
jgi:NAD(P)-dependent dehydrogenase (short-subunit alcohol dehydrogenase family)